ncbi:MAG: hypothetical protein PHR77_08020 [Kiritimatiellae bacterium]|nr:hypothetical protein [Kiritimatiellia bacterium]MDD5521566.1 hypothetical protein [Kiritimatiellia bacterium]
MRKCIIVCIGTVLMSGMVFGGSFNGSDVDSCAKWAVHFDMEKFMTSKIGKLITDEASNTELKKGLDVLRATMRFDPLKDIKSVTLYGDRYQKDCGVAVVRGDANTETVNNLEKIIVASKTHEQVTYGPRVIHKWIGEKNQKSSALCFYAPGVTVLGGEVDKVKMAVDVLDAKRDGLKDNAGLKIPGNAGFLMISARKDENKSGNPAKAAVLQNADWLTIVAGDAGESVNLEFKLGANSQENAQQIEQLVRGMIAFVMLSKEQDQAVADIARAVSVNVENGVVGVKFSYSAEQLYKFIKGRKGPRQQGDKTFQKPENATNGASGNQLFKF